ncbi:BN860_14422g1_1 [Zygosaccharomyces bailii CLIB 213]|uniref:BN860_14422g1_1 n=1 Tax=Zygosaccharomyces bailii (strain CLIB 213 / ATCC 58445 / CBS 680 / BCRC 21525 / NBRC 1098 / NCYC 1416 / NRRL Y-2227) TaxID=1333698 RepID=A0A8J2X8H7_ZYGB2|nr:BN860_14422g1_1 [Zygosaccharomyces bailii CLIB 213]
MGLLTQRKEHRVPDLSRYDYYYQQRDDYNKSPRLSAAAAYAASRSRGNPVLVQQRSQSFTQPRRIVRSSSTATRRRAKSKSTATSSTTPRANSFATTTRIQDQQGRTKSITRRTVRRINGVDYVETVTTTPLDQEDIAATAHHFDEFSGYQGGSYADAAEYPEETQEHEPHREPHREPVRRIVREKVTRKVKRVPDSPRSERSQRSPRSQRSSMAVSPQAGEFTQYTSEPSPPPVPTHTRVIRRRRPQRSRSQRTAKGVPAPASTPAPRRLTEEEMYAKALEIAQRNVYSNSDFPPEVLEATARAQSEQGASRMGQRSLRKGDARGRKKFGALFHRDREPSGATTTSPLSAAAAAGGTGAGAGGAGSSIAMGSSTGGPASISAPRVSGVSSIDHHRADPSAASGSTVSRRNLSDEEMYAQALAMSQSKRQRSLDESLGEPLPLEESLPRPPPLEEVETEPLDLGGFRSPHSQTAPSFVTPAQTIDEPYEDAVEGQSVVLEAPQEEPEESHQNLGKQEPEEEEEEEPEEPDWRDAYGHEPKTPYDAEASYGSHDREYQQGYQQGYEEAEEIQQGAVQVESEPEIEQFEPGSDLKHELEPESDPEPEQEQEQEQEHQSEPEYDFEEPQYHPRYKRRSRAFSGRSGRSGLASPIDTTGFRSKDSAMPSTAPSLEGRQTVRASFESDASSDSRVAAQTTVAAAATPAATPAASAPARSAMRSTVVKRSGAVPATTATANGSHIARTAGIGSSKAGTASPAATSPAAAVPAADPRTHGGLDNEADLREVERKPRGLSRFRTRRSFFGGRDDSAQEKAEQQQKQKQQYEQKLRQEAEKLAGTSTPAGIASNAGATTNAKTVATSKISATSRTAPSTGFGAGTSAGSAFGTQASILGGGATSASEIPDQEIGYASHPYDNRTDNRNDNRTDIGTGGETRVETRPKGRFKSVFDKIKEFGAENSGYQPPREVREAQRAERLSGFETVETEAKPRKSHPWRGKRETAGGSKVGVNGNGGALGVTNGHAAATATTTTNTTTTTAVPGAGVAASGAGGAGDEPSLSSYYGDKEPLAEEGFADGYADALAANGAGNAQSSGVREKAHQAAESSFGQQAKSKAKNEAQSQAKEQKSNLLKKLFKK